MEVASLLICVMSPPVCLPVKKLSDKRFMESNIVRFMSYTSFPATREVMMDESILMEQTTDIHRGDEQDYEQNLSVETSVFIQYLVIKEF